MNYFINVLLGLLWGLYLYAFMPHLYSLVVSRLLILAVFSAYNDYQSV